MSPIYYVPGAILCACAHVCACACTCVCVLAGSSRKKLPAKSYKIFGEELSHFFIIKSFIRNLTTYNYYNSITILLMEIIFPSINDELLNTGNLNLK